MPSLPTNPSGPSYDPAAAPGGNLPLAAAAGLGAALVGAVLWALLAGATHFKIGFAAVGVGYLVGLAMKTVGQGRAPVFGYVGAALALLGCVLGDVLSDCIFEAERYGKSTLDLVSHLSPGFAFDLLKSGFGPLDALFYFIAARAGYRNAFHK